MALKDLVVVSPERILADALSLETAANQVDGDGTPSQVGMTPEELRAVAGLLREVSVEVGSLRASRAELRAATKRIAQLQRDLKNALFAVKYFSRI